MRALDIQTKKSIQAVGDQQWREIMEDFQKAHTKVNTVYCLLYAGCRNKELRTPPDILFYFLHDWFPLPNLERVFTPPHSRA